MDELARESGHGRDVARYLGLIVGDGRPEIASESGHGHRNFGNSFCAADCREEGDE